jgi:hypothetical protein
MNAEMNKEIHSATRELTIDELEVVSGGTGHIVSGMYSMIRSSTLA